MLIGSIRASNFDIISVVSQGSILGLPLVKIYLIDFCNVFKIFELIMFAGDANLFFLHKNIR